jgi:hypothetical protein
MKKIWKFVLANIDTIVAILVSILAAAVGVFGGNQSLLLAGIAATLAILAVGLIRDRQNREILGEQIAELRRSLPNRPSAMAFFRTIPDLGAYFKQATQIDLCGVTLTSTINKNFPLLRERLEAGAKLRFLLIDPSSCAIEMSAQRSDNPIDFEYYQRRVESALTDLTYLHKYYEDVNRNRKGLSKLGSMSVRLISYAPSFGMVNLDTRKKQGIVFVEVYSHKYGYNTPPTFHLTPEDDKDWYFYFVEQYKQMWEAAKPWDPGTYLQKIPFEK